MMMDVDVMTQLAAIIKCGYEYYDWPCFQFHWLVSTFTSTDSHFPDYTLSPQIRLEIRLIRWS